MKAPPIASVAGFLAILVALSLLTPGRSQSPTTSATSSPDPEPLSLQNPSQAIVNSNSPTGAPTPFYDVLFPQKLPIDFGFKVSEAYSDNIFFQRHKTADLITEVTPSLLFTLGQPIPLTPQLDQETIDDKTDSAHGNYLQVSYHPELILYAKNSFLDDVDEYASAIFTHQFARLTLSLEQTYEKLSQPTVQINTPGSLIHRDIFTTTAKANYIYSDQLSTYGTATQTVSTYIGNSYTDNTEWVLDYYFLYQLFPKLSVGLGPRIGFADIDTAPNQSYQDALVHAYFLATGKFTLGGAAGVELREYEHDVSPTRLTPTVEGVATYTPFDSMTVKLDGERHRIVSDGQTGTDYTASIATLELRQRFFQVVFLTLGAGYEEDQYTQAGGGLARDDDIYFLKSALEWKSYRGLTVDASYEYLRDKSNIKAFTFNENRATISASIKY